MQGPIRKLPIIFTTVALGAYVAYFYLVENKNRQPQGGDAAARPSARAAPPPSTDSLPAGVARRLPDGRVLMDDGSIQGAPCPGLR